MTEDSKLLINIKKKRRGSLERVIDIYTPYVSTVVYNAIGSVMTKEDIEEVVSDVFLGLWKNASGLDPQKGCIRTYLGAAARNLSKNKLRSMRQYDELNEDVLFADGTPSDAIENREERQTMIELITSLGEPDSEIFMRYYYYDERVSQIALATGLKISTITTKLSRGREKLKGMILKRRSENEED